jgi:hypothetical protein
LGVRRRLLRQHVVRVRVAKEEGKGHVSSPRTKEGTDEVRSPKHGERDFDCAFNWRISIPPIKATHIRRASFRRARGPMKLVEATLPHKFDASEKISGSYLVCLVRRGAATGNFGQGRMDET